MVDFSAYFSKYCEKMHGMTWNVNILVPTNCKGGENIPEMFPSSHLKLPHPFFKRGNYEPTADLMPFFKFNKSLL